MSMTTKQLRDALREYADDTPVHGVIGVRPRYDGAVQLNGLETDATRRQRDRLAKLAERAADAIEMLQDDGDIGGGHGILGHAQNIRDALAELDSDPGAKT